MFARTTSRAASVLAVIALVAAAARNADAFGTAIVAKTSGVTKTYDHVRIEMSGVSSVRITSADGNGSLTIHHAACSFTGNLQRCLPYDVTAVQLGVKHAIDIEHGTLYVNATDGPLPMPHSTTKIPSHAILLALRTGRGTLISVTGKIDIEDPEGAGR